MTDKPSPLLLGVLGWPIGHSLSPVIHKTFLRDTGLNGVYAPFPVQRADLPHVLKTMPKMGFTGANLTVPHKEAALQLCDELSGAATAIGAVNTLQFRTDGTLLGHNTDADGFYASIEKAVGPHPLKEALVIGAGGAARAVIYALLAHGARRVHVANRTVEKAETLCAFFNDERLSAYGIDFVPELLRAVSLSINTTACGLNGENELPFDFEGVEAGAVVVDIVYAPLLTGFLRSAAAKGLQTVDGLGMLIGQAALSFELWTGVKPNTGSVRDALLRHLKGRVQ